jgi:Tfp pilus assembly protein PilN
MRYNPAFMRLNGGVFLALLLIPGWLQVSALAQGAATALAAWQSAMKSRIIETNYLKIRDVRFLDERTMLVAVANDRGRWDRLARDVCTELDMIGYPPQGELLIRIVALTTINQPTPRELGGGVCRPPE